jgi:HPt (histidine-containing phosphotransfer) domain-containing protein
MVNISSETQSLVHLEAFERLRDALGPRSAEVLPSLLQDFFTNSEHLQEAFQNADLQKRLTTLHLAAHTMRSNSELFGAKKLAQLCRQVELLAREGSLEGVEELLEAIRVETEYVKEVLYNAL